MPLAARHIKQVAGQGDREAQGLYARWLESRIGVEVDDVAATV
jgi:hypothetical protein